MISMIEKGWASMETNLSILSLDMRKNYERQNLSYKLIEGLNYKDNPFKSSFYRSDFRGTQFESDVFHQNNFDLADFINNTFKGVEFYETYFGNSEFKNCFLRNCVFEKNSYDDIAIHGCTFTRCTFQDETFRMTMIGCQFCNCQFINCTFDQCTTDTLSFENCVFLKCELSTMHAENFKFNQCTFRDAFLGTCFLGTYLFKDTDLNLISFKYRGEIVDTSDTFFYNFGNELLQERRFFEYYNFNILFHKDHLDKLLLSFSQILKKSFDEPNPNVRKYNLTGIFETIEFYLGSDNLPLLYALRFYDALCAYPIDNIPKENQLFYLQHLYRLQAMLSSLNYSANYIRAISETIPCTAKIHCYDTSVASAEKYVNSLLEYVNKNYLDDIFIPPYFTTIAHECGSIILTVSSSLLLLLMTAKVISTVGKSLCEIRIENAKTKKAIELINSSRSPAALQKAISALPQSETEQRAAEKIYDQLGNSYLLNFIIQYFLK